MSECSEENTPYHYRGRCYSLGPVGGRESVVFAGFGPNSLTAASFDTDGMKRGDFSMARLRFVPLGEFRSAVIEPGQSKGQFAGVAMALTDRLRNLRISFAN